MFKKTGLKTPLKNGGDKKDYCSTRHRSGQYKIGQAFSLPNLGNKFSHKRRGANGGHTRQVFGMHRDETKDDTQQKTLPVDTN